MADSKISALPASTTPLAGTEVLPIVQSSTTKQVSVANLTAGRDIAATSLTTAAVQATNSGGLTLKNSSGTAQLSVGAGGGDNITLSVATNITPANAAVAISPTGTGTVTINPATASTMNNVAIGGTTALAGKFTSVTDTGLTSGRVTYAGSGGLLTDSANFTFDGSNLYASGKVGATNLEVGTSSPLSNFYVVTARGTTGSVATKTVTISGFAIEANEAYSCEVNVSLIITGNVGNSGAKFLVQGSIGSANSTNYTVTELVRFNNAGSGGGPLSTISAITKAVGSFSFDLTNGSGGQNGVYGISVQNTAFANANCVTIVVT